MRAVMRAGMLASALGASAPAFADSSCRVLTSGLAFGVYEPTHAQPTTSIASFQLECSGGGSVVASLEVEAVAAPHRTLVAGKSGLVYEIYADAAHTRRFTAPITLSAGTSQRVGQTSLSVPIYGVIAPRQWVPAGTYQDQVRITLIY
jgi:spore coat protein U-like protein